MKVNKKITERVGWKRLESHYEEMKSRHMRYLFIEDPGRFERFSIRLDDLFLDYSKNIINRETMDLLVELARETELQKAIEDMFKGVTINKTENRAVLHTALRDAEGEPVEIDKVDVKAEIKEELAKIKEFSEKIRSGAWKGYTGKAITDVVNIGIGGSDLGPLLAVQALDFYGKKNLNIHFVSNVDPTQVHWVQRNLNPETTLFIPVSKSFTTQETLTNTLSLRDWFIKSAGHKKHLSKHFVPVTKNTASLADLGFESFETFTMWDFVGGRYSIWSAVGLSLACFIGYDHFSQFLEGARLMDRHFRTAPFQQNIPVVLALLGIWYNNFFKAQTQAIIPYDQNLRSFPAYLQQCHMESNGKNTDKQGNPVKYPTSPIIWGETGTNSQHSFFQLLHQGTPLVPADFLAPANLQETVGDQHIKLLANFFAQTRALMLGKTREEVGWELKSKGTDPKIIKRILPFNIYEGNKPSNTILYKKLTPRVLGMLIAMYENKIFVQGHIWNIFSFDQWGVELGKQLAQEILLQLTNQERATDHDSSTKGLIDLFKKMKED